MASWRVSAGRALTRAGEITRGKGGIRVRLRKRYLPLMAALGVGLAVIPAVTGLASTSATVGTSGLNWSPKESAVMPPGTVTFENSSGINHGIIWSGGPETPTCDSTVPVGTGKWSTSWKGNCSFSKEGTYTFYCSYHGTSMSGTIQVNASGTTTTTTSTSSTTTTTSTKTTTTTTTSPTSTTTTSSSSTTEPVTTSSTTSAEPPPATTTAVTTTGTPPGGEEPRLESPIAAVSIPGTQRGSAVRGSVQVSSAGAGGSLEVEALAAGASLAKRKHRPAHVRVGRIVRSSVSAGTVRFSVPLNAPAKRAERRHHRLALTLRIKLTPTHGKASTVTRTTVVRS